MLPVEDIYSMRNGMLNPGKGESSPNVVAIGDVLVQLAIDVESADHAPTASARQVAAECAARLARAAAAWSELQKTALPQLDAALRAAGKKEIEIPPADRAPGEPAGDSEDLP